MFDVLPADQTKPKKFDGEHAVSRHFMKLLHILFHYFWRTLSFLYSLSDIFVYVYLWVCVDTFERRKVMNVYTYMTLRGSWSHSVVLFPFKDLTAGATWYVFFTKISFMYSLQFVKYSVMCNLADYSGEITILIRTLNLNIDDIVFRGMLKVHFERIMSISLCMIRSKYPIKNVKLKVYVSWNCNLSGHSKIFRIWFYDKIQVASWNILISYRIMMHKIIL